MPDLETRAVVVTAHGGMDVLEVQSHTVGPPGPGELQIRVAASGVNFIDVYERTGAYPTTPPFVLGNEGAGEVIALGDNVDEFSVGDVVAWASTPGSHSGVVNRKADAVVPVPDGVPAEVAAAVMVQGMTAHYLVTSTYAVQPGDTVLVHAAAGGTGQLLVQLAKSRKAVVFGTVSTAAKQAKAERAGADEVIRYDQVDDLAAEVRRRNGGRGVSVVYDSVGQATFDASLASLAPRRMLVLFGASSGQVPPFDPQRLNHAGSLFLTRPRLAHYTATRDELLWRGGETLAAVRDGTLHVEIGGRYPFADARRAYDDLESRRTTGKLLLIPELDAAG
jgi:NADPH2:quinone reductase